MGQVHTYAKKYVKTQDGFVHFAKAARGIDLRDRSIQVLEQKEKEFYEWLGCTNFQSFITKLRELFLDADKDSVILSNFKKANLDILLGDDKSLSDKIDGQQIELILNKTQNHIKIKDLLGPDFHGPNEEIYFTWQPGSAKVMLNKLEQEWGRTRHRFSTKETSNMYYARQEIGRLINEGYIQDLMIVSTDGSKKQSIKEAFTPSKKSIFGLKQTEIEKAYKDKASWASLKPNLIQRKNKAYNYLLNLCSGGSPTLKMAFMRAWDEKIGIGDDDQSLLNFGFLSTGSGKVKLKGNIQELTVAMITEYINIKIGQGINGRVAKILGDVAKGNKESPKTDVQLFESIGIQVKAYDPDRMFFTNKEGQEMQRLMSTNIHPNKLDSDLGPYLAEMNLSENIGDYMVQACFNKTNSWTDDAFEEAMENAIVQVMNMTSAEGLSDTICFYWVDVTQLVPASHVLKSFEAIEPIVTYRTPGRDEGSGTDDYSGRDDSYYNNENGYLRSDNSLGPNFLYYYQGLDLSITDQNFKTYNDLYTKRISIDIKFDYRFMYDSMYSII